MTFSVELHRKDGSTSLPEVSRRLKVAEQAYREWAFEQKGVTGAFVAGSVASGEADAAADVDLRVVLEGVLLPKAFFSLNEEVPLEWKFLPKTHYLDEETVLFHPFRAVEVVESVFLDDPTGFLASLRERLRKKYDQAFYRRHRAGTLLASATTALNRVQTTHRTQGLVSLWEFRCALFWSVEAGIVRWGFRPTHRRGLVVLREALRQVGAENLYEVALNAFGALSWESQKVRFLWTSLRERLRSVSPMVLTHPYLSPQRVFLWDAAFEELLRQGNVRETALPLWTLLALCWITFPEKERQSLLDLWKLFEMERPHGVRNRIQATREWIETLRCLLDADETWLLLPLDDE